MRKIKRKRNSLQYLIDSHIHDMSQDYTEAGVKLSSNLLVQYFLKVQTVLKKFKGQDTITSFTVLGNKFDLVYQTSKKKFDISCKGQAISELSKDSEIKSFKDITAVSLCQDLAEAELNGLSLSREQPLQQDLKDLDPQNLAKLNISFPKTIYSRLQKNRKGESQQDVLHSVGMKNILTKSEYERLIKKGSISEEDYTSAGSIFIRKNSEVLKLSNGDTILAALARTEGSEEFLKSLFNTNKQHYIVWHDNAYKVTPGVDESLNLSLIKKK